uniref:Epsin-2 n=1 Tax=Cacopsylla melanoneura TaxID=428564 RepID=A0A8D8PSM2_9HEMI
MPRQREDIQVNVAGLRRNIKNLAHNYSDAQVKVREATSNDPWGPSSSLMSDIADLTYNVVAFTEIMQMIWKRLNDSGKNWRHVYKALSLLEYLIKTGSDKVASQCKENIFVIQTLRDFQYLEDGKDQGFNVREKAKTLVTLLGDDERLKNERARQLKARERFQRSASSGFGSEGSSDVLSPSSPTLTTTSYRESRFSCNTTSALAATPELESARPQTAGEEELQLQLALAMSREEAEQEEQKKKSDDVRLQLALSASQSENEIKHHLSAVPASSAGAAAAASPSSHMLDLLEVEPALSDPWALPTTHHAPPTPATMAPRPQVDPWSCPAAIPPADPWAPLANGATPVALPKPAPTSFPVPAAAADPWSPVPAIPAPAPTPASNDPWSLPPQVNTPGDDFDEISNRNRTNGSGLTSAVDPFDVSTITDSLRSTTLTNPSSTPLQPIKKTPHSFLGENSALVNLDNLITVPAAVPTMPIAPLQAQKTGTLANPFGLSGAPSTAGPPAGFTPFTQHHQPQQTNLPSPANPFLS